MSKIYGDDPKKRRRRRSARENPRGRDARGFLFSVSLSLSPFLCFAPRFYSLSLWLVDAVAAISAAGHQRVPTGHRTMPNARKPPSHSPSTFLPLRSTLFSRSFFLSHLRDPLFLLFLNSCLFCRCFFSLRLEHTAGYPRKPYLRITSSQVCVLVFLLLFISLGLQGASRGSSKTVADHGYVYFANVCAYQCALRTCICLTVRKAKRDRMGRREKSFSHDRVNLRVLLSYLSLMHIWAILRQVQPFFERPLFVHCIFLATAF